ncbi:UNVERIFIED_CONTAM: hypothetical protein HDU68_001617 [Siphonaria sp. JEL0065]|nr:hypothetical protein HDU68_001617 [Siphonaria sp. JEL0065]
MCGVGGTGSGTGGATVGGGRGRRLGAALATGAGGNAGRVAGAGANVGGNNAANPGAGGIRQRTGYNWSGSGQRFGAAKHNLKRGIHCSMLQRISDYQHNEQHLPEGTMN